MVHRSECCLHRVQSGFAGFEENGTTSGVGQFFNDGPQVRGLTSGRYAAQAGALVVSLRGCCSDGKEPECPGSSSEVVEMSVQRSFRFGIVALLSLSQRFGDHGDAVR